MKPSQFIIFILVALAVVGCANNKDAEELQKLRVSQAMNAMEPVEAVGYSSMTQYAKYPVPQQHLMAIRAAKLDAYRNIAEELYGVKIKGNTTVKDLIIESDSYRVYVNGLLRGVHVQAVNAKENGLYEAEVILNIDNYMANCLYYPHHACLTNFTNKEQAAWQPQVAPSVQFFSQ